MWESDKKAGQGWLERERDEVEEKKAGMALLIRDFLSIRMEIISGPQINVSRDNKAGEAYNFIEKRHNVESSG